MGDYCFFVAVELDAIRLLDCGVKGCVCASEAGVEEDVVRVVKKSTDRLTFKVNTKMISKQLFAF